MKQRIFNAFVAAGVCLLPAMGYSQQLGGTSPDTKIIGAQNDGGTGMGGLYTPNLYDGSVNVNIPIYDYNNEAGSYGISLTYNTKGVKPDELSSPVGLHFNLIAEGMIQRMVKGFPDELNLTYSDTIWTTSTVKYNKFRGRLASSFDVGAEASNPMVYRDQESDDFMVSVGGLSFTFNIGTGRAIYTNPNRNYSVELQSAGQPYDQVVQQTGALPDPLTIEFLITDLTGNKYHFKKGDYDNNELFADMDASIGAGSIGHYYAISRWVIDYVSLAGGKKITYAYHDQGGSASIYKAYSTNAGGQVGFGVVKKGDRISMIRNINYPNGVTANFVYDTLKSRCDYGNDMTWTGGMALREIRISSGNNCTRYQMDQSYTVVKYGSNTTISEIPYGASCVSVAYMPPNRMHRLRLKGINLLSCDGTVSEPFYTFSYDPTELPLRFSGSQDWFGYFNGKTPLPYGSTADPDLTIPLTPDHSYGVDRNEDINKMKAGILTAIQNAFGGQVSFTYGTHVLTNPLTGLPNNAYYLGANANDGLRIENIIESDIYHPGSYKLMAFSYSEGQRFLSGGYFHYPLVINYVNAGPPGTGSLTGNYLTPHQLISGSNHGYSKVIISNSNELGQLLSKKEIRFTNFSDSLSGYQPRYTRAGGGKHFYEFPYTDKQYIRDWEMGLPMYVINYDQNGKIMEKIVNSYQFSIDTVSAVSKGVQGVKTSFVRDYDLPVPPSGDLFGFMIARVPVTDAYKPYNGTALLINTTTYKYHTDNDFVTDQVSYEYDALNNLKATTTYNSFAGEEIKMINYYNYDVVGYVGSTFFSPFLGQERLLSSQRWKRISGTTGNLPENGLLLDAYFTGMGEPGNNDPASKTWVRNQYQFRNLNPLTYTQYLGTGTYNTTAKKVFAAFDGQDIPYFKKVNEVKDFDENGSPLETQFLGQDQYKAMIWDEFNGQKLAEANARYTDIGFTSFEWTAPVGMVQPDFTTQGNFRFCPARIINNPLSINTPVSGPKIFQLDNTPVFTPNGNINAGFIEGTQYLVAGKTYKLSFWVNGQLPLVFIDNQAIPLSSAAILSSKGNWDNYQVTFTPATSGKISLKANGAQISYVDEVRLHPMNASMVNYTYEPLFGIRTSTDATGRISYFFYDKMGRQYMVRDQEDNIISKKEFVIKGAQ